MRVHCYQKTAGALSRQPFVENALSAGERKDRMGQTVDRMKYRIRLAPDEVNRFVIAATRCDFDVDIAYNSFVVDAKSILGVLGLDFKRPLTVVCHGFNGDFDAYLKNISFDA